MRTGFTQTSRTSFAIRMRAVVAVAGAAWLLASGTASATPGATGSSTGRELPAVGITAGHDAECAVMPGGTADCWGLGNVGQLGNGRVYARGNQGRPLPVRVKGLAGTGSLTNVASLASDGDGFCALLISGSVACWGRGSDGNLGDGLWTSSAVPVLVESPGGSGTLGAVVALASDGDGYCAVLGSGGVVCWGRGDSGQLGDGVLHTAPPSAATPVVVLDPTGATPLTEVTHLAATTTHGGYCALLATGSIDCWGYGANGELGNGTIYPAGAPGSATPVQVLDPSGTVALAGAQAIFGSADSYCAETSGGAVDCWGYGADGELGNGTTYPGSAPGSAVPVEVEGTGGVGTLSGAGILSSDGTGFCAVIADGNLDCWGADGSGQLGNGVFGTLGDDDSPFPVAVAEVGAADTLGSAYSLQGTSSGYCALLTSGGVACWGSGTEGELGNGGYTSSATPVSVVGLGGNGTLANVRQMAGTCAIVRPGKINCWGFGEFGQLGNGQFYGAPNYGSAVPVVVQ